MMKPVTWAVTGAAGYLGSYVVEQLLARGTNVLAIDDGSTGRASHLEPHLASPLFQWEKQDIRDSEKVTSILVKAAPIVVIHLAAIHFIPACNNDPPRTISINVHGTQSVLTAARQADVSRFFLASTGDVYAPSEQPHHEVESTVGGYGIYGLSKLICEQLVALEAKQRPQAGFVVGRLFNLYGPRETNPHFLPEVLSQLKQNPNGVLRLGSLWPKRDLVPVADAARAVIALMDRKDLGVTTVNIASGAAVSMQEVLEQIGKLRNKPLQIETDPAKVRPVERGHLQANVEKLRSLIDWTPHQDVQSALAELLESEG
jgi:UDP-glucose 4-epimerase